MHDSISDHPRVTHPPSPARQAHSPFGPAGHHEDLAEIASVGCGRRAMTVVAVALLVVVSGEQAAEAAEDRALAAAAAARDFRRADDAVGHA